MKARSMKNAATRKIAGLLKNFSAEQLRSAFSAWNAPTPRSPSRHMIFVATAAPATAAPATASPVLEDLLESWMDRQQGSPSDCHRTLSMTAALSAPRMSYADVAGPLMKPMAGKLLRIHFGWLLRVRLATTVRVWHTSYQHESMIEHVTQVRLMTVSSTTKSNCRCNNWRLRRPPRPTGCKQSWLKHKTK